MKKELITTANNMRKFAYAPYSNFTVGAAIETEAGIIIAGCNVENSSYGLCCCAERVCLFNAISNGYKHFTAMAISTSNGGSPCGACRQVIWELCDDINIYICTKDILTKTTSSSKLLPEPFDKTYL